MRHSSIGKNRFVLAATLTLVAGAALAAGESTSAQLDRAAALADQGRLVESQRMLVGIDRSTVSAEERERLVNLMTSVDRRLRRTDPIAISLEKAQIALREGDLRVADRQALAVRRADGASKEQRSEAEAILEESSRLKLELAPMVDSLLEQAVQDFEAERYAEAKGGFDSVYRSGAPLTPAQLRIIDRHRDRISEIESQQGAAFARDYIPMAAFRSKQNGAQDQEAQEQPEDDQIFRDAVRFEAQRRLAEADAAFEEGRYPTALENYLLVANQYRDQFSADELRRAQARVAEIRVLMQQPGGDLLDERIERSQLVRDRAIAEFENLLSIARNALATGDTEQARELASEARLRLSEARQVFSEQEYEQRLAQQRALLQEVIAAEEQIRRDEATRRSQALERQAREQEATREAERARKINESLSRIRALQLEQKYEEALQVVDQVLFLDPLNPAALLMKDTLQDLMIYRDWTLTQRDKSLSYARESNEIQRAMVIPDSLLSYPADWPEISFRRGEPIAFQESPEDRRVLAELRSRTAPANFTDARFEDVMEFFAQVTNLNVDVDWESLADIGVTRDDLVSLNLQPLSAQTVLDRVLRKVSPDAFSRANWAVEDGVLVVASDDALRRNTFVVIYDVRDLLFRVQNFTEVPDLGLGQIIQGQGGGTTSDFQLEEDEGLTEEEMLARIIEIMQTNIDPDGWRDNGGDTGDVSELNGNLIITNTARNHQAIAGLLSQLREVRSIQVSVDAQFLLVNENFFEQIGFDLDVVFNAMNNQFDDALEHQSQFPLIFGPQSLLPTDLIGPFFGGGRIGGTPEFAIQNLDEIIADPTVLPIIGIGPGGEGGSDTNLVPFVVTRPDSLSMIPANQNSASLAQDLLDASEFATSILAANPALQMAGTFLDDIQVDFLLEATQADRRSVTLTSPRLTFTNGASATISVLTEQAFISDLNIITGTGGIGFEPQIGRVAEGFVMMIDGVVSADRRYVTMEVQAQLAEILSLVTFVGASQAVAAGAGANAQGGGGVVQGNIQQPILQTTVIRTGVTVPDQGTILLGGQRLSNETQIETGVPVLSKIPLLNRFFTNRIDDRSESTLLILIKPTILIQSEEEEKNFPGLLDSLENRFGAGF